MQSSWMIDDKSSNFEKSGSLQNITEKISMPRDTSKQIPVEQAHERLQSGGFVWRAPNLSITAKKACIFNGNRV